MGNDLQAAMSHARNGRRLLSLPDLADDVAECVRRDIYSFSAGLVEGKVSKSG
jgi:phosphosulfolactate phosphohydrolase-like enzyme